MIRSCFGRLFAIVLLAAIGALAWLNRDRLLGAWHARHRAVAVAEAPSAALAERAAGKLASLGEGRASTRVALAQPEVQSLIDYRFASAIPSYLHDPRVVLDEDVMEVRARVPREAMPEIPGAGEFISLLPDTTEVAARTRLLPLQEGRVALAVGQISAAKIPLPGRMIPALLRRLGRREEPGLPGDAIAVRLPEGVCSAYVHADSLVLVGREGGCR